MCTRRRYTFIYRKTCLKFSLSTFINFIRSISNNCNRAFGGNVVKVIVMNDLQDTRVTEKLLSLVLKKKKKGQAFIKIYIRLSCNSKKEGVLYIFSLPLSVTSGRALGAQVHPLMAVLMSPRTMTVSFNTGKYIKTRKKKTLQFKYSIMYTIATFFNMTVL